MQSIKWSPLNHIVWVNLEMSPQKFDGFRLQRQRRPFMSCDGFRQGKGSGMGSDKDDHSRPLMSSSERICADENTCGHVFPVLSVRSTSWWEKTWEHQPRERCTVTVTPQTGLPLPHSSPAPPHQPFLQLGLM